MPPAALSDAQVTVLPDICSVVNQPLLLYRLISRWLRFVKRMKMSPRCWGVQSYTMLCINSMRSLRHFPSPCLSAPLSVQAAFLNWTDVDVEACIAEYDAVGCGEVDLASFLQLCSDWRVFDEEVELFNALRTGVGGAENPELLECGKCFGRIVSGEEIRVAFMEMPGLPEQGIRNAAGTDELRRQ